MSYGGPTQAKIKINMCSPRDLELIPGVGRKTVETICNLRSSEGNITPEMFSTLGIRNLPAAMDSVDFTMWNPAAESRYPPRVDGHHMTGPPQMNQNYPSDKWTGAPNNSPIVAPKITSGFYDSPSRMPPVPMRDPVQDWRWHQYRSPQVDGYRQRYPVKAEQEDVSDLWTPAPAARSETKVKPRVSVPKGISYDGRSDWQAFINKFSSYADRESWNSKTRRDVLSWVLEGKASTFYARIVQRNPQLDYFEVVDKLAKRFDIKDLPETTQMLFGVAVQNPKETLIEWCDRVSHMAMQAYPDFTDDQVNKQAVMRFCQGSADKEAGLYAINAKPRTLEDAVDKIKWYQQSTQAIYGKPRREVRRIEEEEEDIQYSVSRLETDRRPRRRTYSPPQGFRSNSDLGQRVENLESNMSSILSSMKSMQEAFKSLETKMIPVTVSTPVKQPVKQNDTPKTSTVGEKAKRRCFRCGEEGHYKLECPHPARKRINQVNDYEEDGDEESSTDEDLNEEGSGL